MHTIHAHPTLYEAVGEAFNASTDWRSMPEAQLRRSASARSRAHGLRRGVRVAAAVWSSSASAAQIPDQLLHRRASRTSSPSAATATWKICWPAEESLERAGIAFHRHRPRRRHHLSRPRPDRRLSHPRFARMEARRGRLRARARSRCSSTRWPSSASPPAAIAGATGVWVEARKMPPSACTSAAGSPPTASR